MSLTPVTRSLWTRGREVQNLEPTVATKRPVTLQERVRIIDARAAELANQGAIDHEEANAELCA
jgi:hypothetical protein